MFGPCLDCILVYNLQTDGRIFIPFGMNVNYTKLTCRMHISATHRGQRSEITQIYLVGLYLSHAMKLHTSVWGYKTRWNHQYTSVIMAILITLEQVCQWMFKFHYLRKFLWSCVILGFFVVVVVFSSTIRRIGRAILLTLASVWASASESHFRLSFSYHLTLFLNHMRYCFETYNSCSLSWPQSVDKRRLLYQGFWQNYGPFST